jgi:azurin
MFQKIMNRRHLLLTLSGVGGLAVLLGLWSNRDSAPAHAVKSGFIGHSEQEQATAAPTTTETTAVQLDVACAENELAFASTKLTAPPNTLINLTFHNVSTLFMHNWVLVDGDEREIEHVLHEGGAAGPEQSYIPADTSRILAHTQLIASGQSATITFPAPPPGVYVYVCTFPGHCLAGMRGALTITA